MCDGMRVSSFKMLQLKEKPLSKAESDTADWK